MYPSLYLFEIASARQTKAVQHYHQVRGMPLNTLVSEARMLIRNNFGFYRELTVSSAARFTVELYVYK